MLGFYKKEKCYLIQFHRLLCVAIFTKDFVINIFVMHYYGACKLCLCIIVSITLSR